MHALRCGAFVFSPLLLVATASSGPGSQQDPEVVAEELQDEVEAPSELPDATQAESETPAEEIHFLPINSRWFAPGNPVFAEGDIPIEPPPYEINRPGQWWNSYRQNKLKGDFPILGTHDIFLNVTATSRTILEARKVPTPTLLTGPVGSVTSDFFGDGHQTFWNQDLSLTFDVFKGPQAFKPVDWRVKITPVFNHTDLGLEEVGLVEIDSTEGRTRQRDDAALQEALIEYHLFDLTDRYDFISSELGLFPFRSDFRGFIFDDVNLGARIFGNYDDNKWQYNFVVFDMRDKDTNSLLNNTDDREQEVYIANVFRQDWPWKGYITSFSVHHNNDHRGTHFNDNGFLVSPAPVGLAQENEVESTYLGWAGEGHIGRINVTHALYQVLGEESQNPFAAQPVDINAQFAALELSYDIDFYRLRAYGMYASGDSDATDGDAEGFDAILDAANFAGGPFSFFNSQVIGLLGVQLTNFQSFLPDLQTSKFEGQSNFVNPGLTLLGGAVDVEITPTQRAMLGVNYLRFNESSPLEVFLELPTVESEIGVEAFLAYQWRPPLTNNMLLIVGASALQPGAGFERIYQSDDTVYSTFFNMTLTW